MGIVFRPEPPPPATASYDEKLAWYKRERPRAVAALACQQGTLNFSWTVLIAVTVLAVMLALGGATINF